MFGYLGLEQCYYHLNQCYTLSLYSRIMILFSQSKPTALSYSQSNRHISILPYLHVYKKYRYFSQQSKITFFSIATTYSGLLIAEQGWCCSQEQEEVIKFNIAFYGKISIQKYNFVEIIKPTTRTGVFLFNNVYTHTRL